MKLAVIGQAWREEKYIEGRGERKPERNKKLGR